ncbi:MAG TPA: NYN domain-containing protein, partial [Candidatus Parcubacteria bacterium]|nr:NYN domain-containing protein [Candidatus Parcubacteria bacterium]
MVIKHSGQRVGVLIDVQNLYYSAKNIYRAKVNFREILKTAVSNRNLIRVFAYVVRTKTNEEKPFFEALTKLGIETRVRDLQEFYGGQKKADWDVGIVIDAVRLAPSVDVLVLVSGDGDFVSLVEYLKNQGKRVEVMAFGRSASSRLK